MGQSVCLVMLAVPYSDALEYGLAHAQAKTRDAVGHEASLITGHHVEDFGSLAIRFCGHAAGDLFGGISCHHFQ